METKNKAYTIIWFVLAASLIGNVILFRLWDNQKIANEFDHAKAFMEIQQHEQQAAVFRDSAANVVNKWNFFRDSTNQLIETKDARIRRLLRLTAAVAPPNQQEDTICERFIVASLRKDTVITAQQEIIQTHKMEVGKLDTLFTEYREFKEQEISQKDSAITVLMDRQVGLENDLAKEQKKVKRKETWNKIWKTVSAVAAGVAAVFILK